MGEVRFPLLVSIMGSFRKNYAGLEIKCISALDSHLSGELRYSTFEQPASGQYFILHNSVI